jgi:SNF2 family DNA or RNA helicase
MILQSGHAVTSKLLEDIKKELGIPIETKKRRSPGIEDEELEYEEPLSYADNICFIESEEEEKRRKRRRTQEKKVDLDINNDKKRPLEVLEDEKSKKAKVEDEQVKTTVKQPTFVLPPPPVQCTEFSSSKMLHLVKILEEIKQTDPEGKTVIFSQFTTMLDVTEAMLLKLGYKVRLHKL